MQAREVEVEVEVENEVEVEVEEGLDYRDALSAGLVLMLMTLEGGSGYLALHYLFSEVPSHTKSLACVGGILCGVFSFGLFAQGMEKVWENKEEKEYLMGLGIN